MDCPEAFMIVDGFLEFLYSGNLDIRYWTVHELQNLERMMTTVRDLDFTCFKTLQTLILILSQW